MTFHNEDNSLNLSFAEIRGGIYPNCFVIQKKSLAGDLLNHKKTY